MDQWLRKTLEDAFAVDDAAREPCERDLTEPVERATSRYGIVYKTYLNEPRHESEHEPHSEMPAHRTMSQEESRRWNEWLDKRLQTFGEEFASLLGEESGKIAREERKRYEKMLGELRDEIGAQRAEIARVHAQRIPDDVSLKVTPLRSAR